MSERGLIVQAVEIEGFRGIGEGRLELTPLTVLVGLNGSGKTAVLEALYLASGHREGQISLEDRDPAGRCPILHVLRRHAYAGAEVRAPDAELTLRSESSEPASIHRHMAELEIRSPKWLIHVGRHLARVRVESPPTTQTMEDWDRSRQAALLDPFTGVELEEALWFPRTATDPPALIGGRDRWIAERLREIYPGLPLQGLSGARGGGEREGTVWAVMENYAVPVEHLGDGIQSAFRALALLAVMDRGLFLWDEPEDHQHPDALESLMRILIQILRERPSLQAVIATQSREALAALYEAAAHDPEGERWAQEGLSLIFLILNPLDGKLYGETIRFDELRFMESVDIDIRKLWRERRIREPRRIPPEVLERLSQLPGAHLR